MTQQSPYIVSARKYRPATFNTVVGQENLTNTLRNAVATHRIAQAYLFCGPRGVGKTSCARIFARSINCLNPSPEGEACGECESCRAIEEGTSFNLVELDAASNNGVDSMRNLTEQVNTPPQSGRYRVFIIDEVHMLTSQAFNAFLKTLEEPPSYVVFILATTEKHKVLPTILSRCQIYDFKRITTADMSRHLQYVASKEGIEAESEALDVIAGKADGAMRDALSIFDQVAASSGGKITYRATIDNLNILDWQYYFKLVEAFRAGDVAGSLLLYADIRANGFDSQFFVNGLATHVRDLMLAADPKTAPLLEQGPDLTARYTEQARSLPLQWYYAAMRLLNDCDASYRTATDKRLLVELTLIRLCQLLSPPTPPFDRVDQGIPLQPVKVPAAAAPAPHTYAPAEGTAPQPAVATGSSPDASRPRPAPEVPAPQPFRPAPAAEGVQRPVAGRGRRRTTRLSEAAAHAGSEGGTRRQERKETFTDMQVAEAWQEFAATHPDQIMLATAMRKSLPARISDTVLRITATHPAEAQAFETGMQQLVDYLRSKTANDAITLEIEMAPEAASHPHSKPAILQEMLGNNKALADFLSHFESKVN